MFPMVQHKESRVYQGWFWHSMDLKDTQKGNMGKTPIEGRLGLGTLSDSINFEMRYFWVFNKNFMDAFLKFLQ